MITHNVSNKEGLVNGATGILRDVTKKENSDEITIFQLKFEDSDIGRATRNNNFHYLEGISMTNKNIIPIFPVVVTDIAVGKKMVTRKQCPLIPAEAVTTHKSQSQTYPSVCAHIEGMT